MKVGHYCWISMDSQNNLLWWFRDAACFLADMEFISVKRQTVFQVQTGLCHGPLTRYVKLRVAHALGMPGTFSPPPRVSDPDMHHGTCVTHVPWCMPGSPTSGFLWSQWRGKRSRHSRRMRNPPFWVSAKRPIETLRYVTLVPTI